MQQKAAAVGNTIFPFGPGIYANRLEEQLVQDILEHARQEQRDDAKKGLVGQLAREVWLTSEFVKEKLEKVLLWNVEQYLEECSAAGRIGPSTPFAYNVMRHRQMKEQGLDTSPANAECRITSAWVNFTKPGPDFNPPHVHNSDLSSVLYLELPDKMGSLYSGETPWQNNGLTTFLCGNAQPFSCSEFVIGKPQVGLLLIFPANLVHFVMPFMNESGEHRTTASINFQMSSEMTTPPWRRNYDWELPHPR